MKYLFFSFSLILLLLACNKNDDSAGNAVDLNFPFAVEDQRCFKRAPASDGIYKKYILWFSENGKFSSGESLFSDVNCSNMIAREYADLPILGILDEGEIQNYEYSFGEILSVNGVTVHAMNRGDAISFVYKIVDNKLCLNNGAFWPFPDGTGLEFGGTILPEYISVLTMDFDNCMMFIDVP